MVVFYCSFLKLVFLTLVYRNDEYVCTEGYRSTMRPWSEWVK